MKQLEKLEDIVFGAIYTENEKLIRYFSRYYEPLNDQKNHFWYPIRVVKDGKDEIYMVDNYQFELPYECRKNYSKMIDYLKSLGEPKDNSWKVYQTSNYYYSARLLLTEHNVNSFNLIAKFDEYKPINKDETPYYKEEDVIEDLLFDYYDKDYRKYRYIKKVGAEIVYEKQIKTLVNRFLYDIQEPRAMDYELDKALELVKEAKRKGEHYDKNHVEYAIKLHKKILSMKISYSKYKDKLSKELLEND